METYLSKNSQITTGCDLPSVFVLCEPNTFVANDKITDTDIIAAAQFLLTQQFMESPLTLDNPTAAKQLVIFRLAKLQHECFCVIFLNNKGQLIAFEPMFQGTINRVTVYSREIAKRSFDLNATAIILVHNHPSGDCMPSVADKKLTASIKSTFEELDIKVLDHLVVGGDKAYSFCECGLL